MYNNYKCNGDRDFQFIFYILNEGIFIFFCLLLIFGELKLFESLNSAIPFLMEI